jgi:SAM-dependent methyltransferase
MMRSMTDRIAGWQWDASLFAGTARHYLRGRLPYAPGFAATIAAVLSLDGRGRLLDVGCGPGNVTRALAPYFAEAVGLDPDAGMLAEAARLAGPEADPPDARPAGDRRAEAAIRWVKARAEELPAGLGRFRVVTLASAFHWMDRARVAATIRDMLEPGGAIVHIAGVHDAPPATAPLPHPAPPYERIADLVRRYLGPVRRAGQGTIATGETPGREDLVIAAAGFVDYRRITVPAGHAVDRSTDDVVAWTLSLSGSAPHLFGDHLADFERDLRTLLHDAGGHFAEHVPPTDLQIWRRP